MTRERKVCETCGSTNVMYDGWAEWDEDKQEWVLGDMFENAYCGDCECECHIETKPIEEE